VFYEIPCIVVSQVSEPAVSPHIADELLHGGTQLCVALLKAADHLIEADVALFFKLKINFDFKLIGRLLSRLVDLILILNFEEALGLLIEVGYATMVRYNYSFR